MGRGANLNLSGAKTYEPIRVSTLATAMVLQTHPVLAQGEIVATRTFHGAAHQTSGRATIYYSGGKETLRLTHFKTSNGPDVHVVLIAATDAQDNENFLCPEEGTYPVFCRDQARTGSCGDYRTYIFQPSAIRPLLTDNASHSGANPPNLRIHKPCRAQPIYVISVPASSSPLSASSLSISSLLFRLLALHAEAGTRTPSHARVLATPFIASREQGCQIVSR